MCYWIGLEQPGTTSNIQISRSVIEVEIELGINRWYSRNANLRAPIHMMGLDTVITVLVCGFGKRGLALKVSPRTAKHGQGVDPNAVASNCIC